MTSLTMSYAQKSLILYYSETGTTKTVAQELQKQLGADLDVTVGKEQGAKPEFTEVVR